VNRTGLLTDPRFRAHVAPYEHPERPERLAAIEARFEADGLRAACRGVAAREATDEELLAVHTPRLISEIDATAHSPFSQLDPDTYTSAQSARAARLAAGGLVDLTREVLAGELANGFALLRPPGHHAEADRAMGFCLFNNVAVAAKAAQNIFATRAAQESAARKKEFTKPDTTALRVLIVDWDVHHGNGSQNTFWDDPSVLYFSTHQYPFYPGTGAIGETGGPHAQGRTINVPWPGGRGDADYLAAFDRVLIPAARKFEPDLVIVSAGFDAARGDLLGEQRISPEGYAAMTARLSQLAGGRLVLALEGGYTLEAIAASAAACLRVLLEAEARSPLPSPPPSQSYSSDFGPPTATAAAVLEAVISTQRPFWLDVWPSPS
jgi:acetoin utilization deacetylase AcuC-like enzyme